MSGFSNRVEEVPAAERRQELRASADRAIAELDRLASLPAGHPDILRAWGADQKVPVPAHIYELLETVEYEQFERELSEHLEGLP